MNKAKDKYCLVSKCSESEIQEIEVRRKKCVTQKEQAFQSSQVEKTQGLLCSYIEEIIEDCSEEYNKCYHEQQMKQFKALQIQIFEQLIGAHKDSVAQTFVMRKKIKEISIKYGACINKTDLFQSKFEKIVSNPKAFKEVEKIFCEFYTILEGCGGILRECYPEEKLKETSSGQLDIIKTLMQQAGLQLPNNCDKEEHQPAGAGSIIASISLIVPLIHLLN
ncbi:unnamed protein product [Lepeophtheirus salmonis]|uniref:(salmon louse) hypothetical protein n=1 Tax=Lepeophtheirus salmonis TaxID=72036 RepID=A0A7R8CRU2_LEPSM|nr:unnamed protein product [Lepeophtheirus salmonis]CAF2873739.1 unnamed protein product [Lepeophtheirus salmonis]